MRHLLSQSATVKFPKLIPETSRNLKAATLFSGRGSFGIKFGLLGCELLYLARKISQATNVCSQTYGSPWKYYQKVS